MEVTNHININASEMPQKQVATYLASSADGSLYRRAVAVAQIPTAERKVKMDAYGNCPGGYYKTSDASGKFTCEKQYSLADGGDQQRPGAKGCNCKNYPNSYCCNRKD